MASLIYNVKLNVPKSLKNILWFIEIISQSSLSFADPICWLRNYVYLIVGRGKEKVHKLHNALSLKC